MYRAASPGNGTTYHPEHAELDSDGNRDRLGTLTLCLGTLTQCLGTLTLLYRRLWYLQNFKYDFT